MKRILTIFLAVMMLFSITGCDPESRATLAGYMGKMGQNVLGSDTSSVNKVVDMVKVNKDKIQTATVGGEAVKVSDNVSMKVEKEGEKVVTKVTVGGVDIKVDAEVKSVLPPLEKEEKDNLVEEIGKNIKTPEKKKDFVTKMSAVEEDKDVIEATAGSAVVMKAAIEQVAEKIPVPENPEQKKQIEELKKSITGLTSNLDKIASSTESVSKADVVTIQLVQNFVETVSTAKIEPGNVPTEVLTDASNLLTVTSALSEASKFDAANVIENLSSVLVAPKEAAPRGLARALEDEKGLTLDPEKQNYVNLIYTAVVDVLSNEDFGTTKSGLGFHYQSYENYVNMLATKVDLTFKVDEKAEKATADYQKESDYLKTTEFDRFNTFEGVIQYFVAAAISEADDLYADVRNQIGNGVSLEIESHDAQGHSKPGEYEWITYKKDVSKFPADFRALFMEIVELNPWIKTPDKVNDVKFKFPASLEFLNDEDSDDCRNFLDILLKTMHGRDLDYEGTMNPGKRQYGRSALETANKAVVFTGIGDLAKSLGDIDIHYSLLNVIDEFFVDSTLRTKSTPAGENK